MIFLLPLFCQGIEHHYSNVVRQNSKPKSKKQGLKLGFKASNKYFCFRPCIATEVFRGKCNSFFYHFSCKCVMKHVMNISEIENKRILPPLPYNSIFYKYVIRIFAIAAGWDYFSCTQ